MTAAAVCGYRGHFSRGYGLRSFETNQTAATTDAGFCDHGVPTSTPKPSLCGIALDDFAQRHQYLRQRSSRQRFRLQVITPMTPTPTAEITEEPTKTPEPTQEPEDSSADTVESAAESTANSKASDEANSTSSSAAANGTASSPYAGEGNTATNNQK